MIMYSRPLSVTRAPLPAAESPARSACIALRFASITKEACIWLQPGPLIAGTLAGRGHSIQLKRRGVWETGSCFGFHSAPGHSAPFSGSAPPAVAGFCFWQYSPPVFIWTLLRRPGSVLPPPGRLVSSAPLCSAVGTFLVFVVEARALLPRRLASLFVFGVGLLRGKEPAARLRRRRAREAALGGPWKEA